jgi:hypothetical protein
VIPDATDARYFDAPADAPYACPPSGTPLRFSDTFVQVVPRQQCAGYTISTTANLAFAVCNAALGTTQTYFAQSTPDAGALDPVTVSPAPNLFQAALSPDGELWLERFDGTSSMQTISSYRPGATPATWVLDRNEYVVPGQLVGMVGAPMPAGAGRRLLYASQAAIYEIVEASPGVWQPVTSYSAASLGVTQINSPPDLSPDGLRVVFSGQRIVATGEDPNAVLYATRASLSAGFGKATVLDGPPLDAETPFLTADCSRLYFSGLDSVFYVTQMP